MASTFSPTLRIELIGDGDQSGIWGQTTNTNLGSLIEQAITGVQSITMVDANYTLTSFNGVVDEARNAVLVVGGTNSQVRDVIAPLVEKLYVIKNNTVGGFGINIRGSTGSAVLVPSGATVWVYCDGTNFNAINTESVGNFEVNGNLTVTGNTNAVAATYTGNVVALNYSTAGNVSATGNVTATGNATATNFIGAGLTLTSINASNISAGTIANARTTAASANGASTIVARDASGNFTANAITTTSISGNGVALTAINASNISSGTLATARGGTGLNSFTSGGAMYATSTSALTTGTLPVASGGTGVTTSTGSGNVVLSASPTLTGAPLSTTAANGTNTTQIATTAFVQNTVTNLSLGTMSTQNANNVNITGGSITGITDLAVADGGTGRSSLTANNLILGNGTSAVNFVAPSTSGLAVRSDGTTFTMQKLGLGMTGEIWNGVTGSRALNQTYTNNNSYPIMVTVSLGWTTSGSNDITYLVGGQVVGYESGNSNTDTGDSFSFIVPPGQTYRINLNSGGATIGNWAELY